MWQLHQPGVVDAAKRPSVLVLGGLDPSGGAGLAIDVAAVRAAGGHPLPVCLVNTRQDGRQFQAAFDEPPQRVIDTARLLLQTQQPAAIKIGAMGSAQMATTLIDFLSNEARCIPVVLDPVLRSSSGGTLFPNDHVSDLLRPLLAQTTVVTPNIPEAQNLTRTEITTPAQMSQAAIQLASDGPANVLIKGGHLPGPMAVDVWYSQSGKSRTWSISKRVQHDVRGTGCALAAAIATRLAVGDPVAQAIEKSRDLLDRARKKAYATVDGPLFLNFD